MLFCKHFDGLFICINIHANHPDIDVSFVCLFCPQSASRDDVAGNANKLFCLLFAWEAAAHLNNEVYDDESFCFVYTMIGSIRHCTAGNVYSEMTKMTGDVIRTSASDQ